MINNPQIKSFLIQNPGYFNHNKISFLVEKHRLNSGTLLKKTRQTYGANEFYYLNNTRVSKQIYKTALEEVDNCFSSLKKITDVLYFNSSQIRIDYYLNPRFGLVILKTSNENDIPNFFKIIKDVTYDLSYQDKFILNDKLDASIKNLSFSILPPA